MTNVAPPRSRRQWLTIAAEVAGILGTAAAVFALVLSLGGTPTSSEQGPVPSTGTGPRARPETPATQAPPTVPANQVLLDSREPETGATNLVAAPHGLEGNAAYAHALFVQCPSGQTADRYRSVTYPLDGGFARLRANFRPYAAAASETKVQLQVYVDSRPPVLKVVPANGQDTIDVELYDAAKVELRFTCTLPGPVAVLTDAYLERR